MTVLILAGERDLSADAMVRQLQERDVPVFRIDMAWFPQQLTVEAVIRSGRWEGRLATPHRVVELEGVRSILYRTPSTFQFPTTLSQAERQHAHNEAKLGLGGVLASLPTLWINHPSRQADAAYKPVQLAAAVECGLKVPDTLVTNTADAVRNFIAETGGDGAVTKMFGAPAMMESGGRRVAYTERIGSADLHDLRGIDATAHQFQRWVPKSFEVRMVCVGELVFTIGIHAASDTSRVDWRSDYAALDYEIVEPPGEVATAAQALMKRFGLLYGAFDFVVTPDGEWFFLELNPGGQYGWLDELDTVAEHFGTARPITSALAERLAEGAL